MNRTPEIEKEIGPCDNCHGRRWARAPESGGAYTCDCLRRYVMLKEGGHAILRGDDTAYPWQYHESRWSLEDMHVVGDWGEFRRRAWASIAPLQVSTHVGFKVEVMDTARMQEIAFQRDDEFKSLQYLKSPNLLIVLDITDIGASSERHAALLRSHLGTLLHARSLMARKPTWLFTPTVARAFSSIMKAIYAGKGFEQPMKFVDLTKGPEETRVAGSTPPPTSGPSKLTSKLTGLAKLNPWATPNPNAPGSGALR